jgi:hypothetical protein
MTGLDRGGFYTASIEHVLIGRERTGGCFPKAIFEREILHFRGGAVAMQLKELICVHSRAAK